MIDFEFSPSVAHMLKELEAMDDSDTAIIRQDQTMDAAEDSDSDDRDDERIEQDQDIEALIEDALEMEVQNLAFILSQHTSTPLNEEKNTDASFADKAQSKNNAPEKEIDQEVTKSTMKQANLKQITATLQKNITKDIQPASGSFSDKAPSPSQKAEGKSKPPEGRTL